MRTLVLAAALVVASPALAGDKPDMSIYKYHRAPSLDVPPAAKNNAPAASNHAKAHASDVKAESNINAATGKKRVSAVETHASWPSPPPAKEPTRSASRGKVKKSPVVITVRKGHR